MYKVTSSANRLEIAINGPKDIRPDGPNIIIRYINRYQKYSFGKVKMWGSNIGFYRMDGPNDILSGYSFGFPIRQIRDEYFEEWTRKHDIDPYDMTEGEILMYNMDRQS